MIAKSPHIKSPVLLSGTLGSCAPNISAPAVKILYLKTGKSIITQEY